MDFVDPSLFVALLDGGGVYFGGYADYAGDVSGLRLRSRHSAESGGHEEHASDSGLAGALVGAGGV